MKDVEKVRRAIQELREQAYSGRWQNVPNAYLLAVADDAESALLRIEARLKDYKEAIIEQWARHSSH